jgi:hypothetical protein
LQYDLQEEGKAVKRIQQTKEKVSRLLAVRAQAEERAQAKQAWSEEQQQQLEQQRHENSKLKEQNKKAK